MAKGFYYRYRRKLKSIVVDGGIKFVDRKANMSYMVYGVPEGTVAYFEHGGKNSPYIRVSVTTPAISITKYTVTVAD